MNTKNNARRNSVQRHTANQIANHKGRRTLTNALPFERLEDRRLMAATAVKSVDSGGLDYSMVETGGHVYVLTSSASGAGSNQIYVTDGDKKTSKILVDCTKAGSTVQSLDDLTVTEDGRVIFTATASSGGRQIFQLTSKGFTQLTKKAQGFYTTIASVGDKIYAYDSTAEQIDIIDAKNVIKKVSEGNVSKMFVAKGQLFYLLSGDGGLYRSNGTSSGTYRIDGNGTLSVNSRSIFASTDWLYFTASVNNNLSLYRSNGSSTTPVKIADDFAVQPDAPHVELGDSIYFSGGYYNTSPNAAGSQLYRVVSTTGVITKVTNQNQDNGGAALDGISGIGTNIYFVSNDGDYIQSEGTYDRELFRYSTVDGTTTQVTDDETLVPISVGGGVLGSYYFVAAPTKVGSRFGGVRKLYRTTPTNDEIEVVGGVPSYSYSDTEKRTDVKIVFGGGAGLFFSARNDDKPGDSDVYFVPTPFSYVDPVTHKLTIEGSANADNLAIKVVGSNLQMTLNGITETRALADFVSIDIYLKDGNDKLTTDKNVLKNMNVFGDSGDDNLQTGSGNDYVLTGAGKNTVFGGAGNDKLKGAGGQDKLNGDDGVDVLYGRGGSDVLEGGTGIDVLRGDDSTGPYGNDTLRGGSSNDRLYGYGGDDRLEGGKQNDSLVGGDGNDIILGDLGDDFLDGGAGLNELYGGDGNDEFNAQYNSLDLIDGGTGTDKAKKDNKEKKVFSIETIV